MSSDAQSGVRGEYERGVTAGAIETRLADHDRHFSAINGHLADIAQTLTQVELDLQRLADQAVSQAASAASTAAALHADGESRLRESDRRWTPVQRVAVILSLLVAAVALYAALRGVR